MVRPRHKFFTWFANWFIFRPFWLPFLHYHPAVNAKQARSLRKKGPYLIVSNHISAVDPVLLTATLRQPVYYVASEVIFSMGLVSKLLSGAFAPIPKAKAVPDMSTVLNMLRIIKEGGSVGVFVEGNISYTGGLAKMPESIGKIAKMMKRPVLVFNFHYLYLSSPRWATKRRRGKAYGAVEKIYSVEQLASMSVDEINQAIYRDIDAQVYLEQEQRPFKTKHMAEHLHRLIFMCPKCGTIGQMHGHDQLTCHHCGFTAHYDEFGYLKSTEFGRQTLIDIDQKMQLDFEKYLNENRSYTLTVPARLVIILKKHRKRPGMCKLTIDETGITFTMLNRKAKDNSEQFPIEQIIAFAIQGKKRFLFYIRGQYTRLVEFDEEVSPYQILLMMQVFKQRDNYRKGATDYELVSHDPSNHLGL